MSRKIILSLAAAAALVAATLVSGTADAHHSGGHGHSGKHSAGHSRNHVHISHLRGGVDVQPVGYSVNTVHAVHTARAVEPGPCTCLSKSYTDDGQVVFKDQCTKEMASTPASGSSDQAQNEQDPAKASDETNQDDNSETATESSK